MCSKLVNNFIVIDDNCQNKLNKKKVAFAITNHNHIVRKKIYRINMGDFIQVNVSNSQNDVISFEKKFPKDLKISELKVN